MRISLRLSSGSPAVEASGPGRRWVVLQVGSRGDGFSPPGPGRGSPREPGQPSREAPSQSTTPIVPAPLACSPADPAILGFRQGNAGPGSTARAGRLLFDALAAIPAVGEQLTLAVARNVPLYIADDSPTSQALPWEALCRTGDGRFFALDGPPLGRTVKALEAGSIGPFVFDPPLRVLAVLAAAGGAAGLTARREWEALSAAMAGAAPLEVEVAVVGCDDEVRDAVDAADGAPSFSFLTSADELLAAARDFQPHVAHFFCHGFVDPGWEPDGVVWLAHACCSAGSVASSGYAGLFDPGDPIAELLAGVSEAAGSRTAPLPRRLLGHPKPARAFLGQVEPTFDWTLSDPDTGQPLSNALCDAVYPRLTTGPRR